MNSHSQWIHLYQTRWLKILGHWLVSITNNLKVLSRDSEIFVISLRCLEKRRNRRMKKNLKNYYKLKILMKILIKVIMEMSNSSSSSSSNHNRILIYWMMMTYQEIIQVIQMYNRLRMRSIRTLESLRLYIYNLILQIVL